MKAILIPLLLLLTACQRESPAPPSSTPRAPAATVPALAAASWTLPVTSGAQPDLIATPAGELVLSWIEKGANGHALRFARAGSNGWSTPATIAEGRDWFVNWADTPHVQTTPDGALWAHWLRKSAAATYAYDVVLSRSADGGRTWSAPIAVNDDGTPTEHGFVSMWPAGNDRLGIAWLDGRDTGGGHGGPDGHGGGMMSLRSATFDAALGRHGEVRVDASVCDCCQTDIAATTRGALLVYRDRTEGEIRDIAATRLQEGTWTTPVYVHADRWKMPACPVNGPAVASRGEPVVVGWYTGAGSAPSVRLARSNDAGESFGPALVLDHGPEVLGRVDVAMDARHVFALWLREDAQGQSLWLARLPADLGSTGQRLKLATLAGRGRGTGMPKMVLAGERLHVVWTDVVDGAPQLQGATVALR